MARTRPSSAGGFLVAIGVVAGFVVGTRMGQPSAGFLIGLGLGVALALAVWLRDRSRS